MSFIQVKCRMCGGPVTIDDNKNKAECEFCGTPVAIRSAVNDGADVANAHSDDFGVESYENTGKDFVVENGVLKKYQGFESTLFIPEGIVAIAPKAFTGTIIKKVTLPSTLRELQSINEYDSTVGSTLACGPFYNCSCLEEVVLSKGLNKIGAGAFALCYSLKSVNLPDSITSIGDGAFMSTCFSSITIPSTVKTVGAWAFKSCFSLVSVNIHPGVKVNTSAFEDTPYDNEKKAIEEAERATREAELQMERERKAEDERNSATLRKRKSKKRAISTASIISIILVAAVVLTTLVIPMSRYNEALELMNYGEYGEAAILFNKAGIYKDSQDKAIECQYYNGKKLMDEGDLCGAFSAFIGIIDYNDSRKHASDVLKQINSQKHTISSGLTHTVALNPDGTVVAVGENKYGECDVQYWIDMVEVSAGTNYTIGLRDNNTVMALGDNNNGQCNIWKWRDITAVSAGAFHTVGLRSDSTVVATGVTYAYEDDYSSVTDWTDIVSISAGASHTVGLKSDGTVVAVGVNDYGQCDVGDWTDIVAISAGDYHTVGLKSDGTVVAVGGNDKGECEVGDWNNIISISAAECQTVGLKADGTVVVVGSNSGYQPDVSGWSDIVAVSADAMQTVGLKSDGTVLSACFPGNEEYCDVSSWSDISVPNIKNVNQEE